MPSSPVDPALVMQQAAHNDLVQRKLSMDALRKRLGDTATKEEKLRESCEGFEAIFLQKMWEQMRKTVPKEGYLHSKDEEMYQSLFDVEMCKKMAGAGGIGLADMLYEQLSRQLVHSGRATSPGAYSPPLDIAPAGLMPLFDKAQQANAPAPDKTDAADKALAAQALYTPLPEQPADDEEPAETDAVEGALQEIRASLGIASNESGAAAREWAQARLAATGLAASAPLQGATNLPEHSSARAAPEAGKRTAPAEPRGLPAQGTLWPLGGSGGEVVSRFGWEDDRANGKRRWNSGVQIAAPPQSPVRAILDGTVVYAGRREDRGHTVVMEHKEGFRSYYGNLEEIAVRVGDRIARGSEFAKLAAQPSSPAKGENSASLHFELKKGEMALNPENAIQRGLEGSAG